MHRLALSLLLVLLAGCSSLPPKPARLAVDLGAMAQFIGGDGSVSGVGLAKTFRALAAMGYDGVVFDGFWQNDARTIRTMLSDSGLAACASKVGKDDEARLPEFCEFNLNLGNNLLLLDTATPEAKSLAARQGCEIAHPPAAVEDATFGLLEKNGELWHVFAVKDLSDALRTITAVRAR